MTNLDFMKEEYLTLRREIEAAVSELATLERQCVLATAGIYTWLVTAGLKGETLVYLAWSIPVILSTFGALRSLSTGQHLRRLSCYIQEIEREVAQSNKYAKGWEHFHSQATKNKFRTKVRVAAWLTLITLTLCIAFYGPTIEIKPNKTLQQGTP
ncbi:MAG: hypothetical protein ACOYL3_10570 [Desulfuromonadaceae bacterium]